MKKIDEAFFEKDTVDLAKALLGKILVRKSSTCEIYGRISEVEAYLGVDDPACHSYKGKKTNRNKIMYEKAGTIYLYQTYGIHRLLNLISMPEGVPEGVLIRGVKIIKGLNQASLNRYSKSFEDLSKYQRKNISNGPGKVTRALDIDKSFNGKDIFSSKLFLLDDGTNEEIFTGTRIGIDYAGEASMRPLRFFTK